MNKVILVGRLTRDPELRFTAMKGTATSQITLAVDKYNAATGEREADFINVVIWGKQAEATANHMLKGGLMAVCGRLQTRSYDGKDGTKRYVTEVVASEIQFLSKGSGAAGKGNETLSNDGFGGMGFDDDLTPVDDGDIPF